MRVLLDTQLFLWFAADSSKLSKKARMEIERADEVWVSAASIWEATIKSALGKLAVDPRALVGAIADSDFLELPVRASHAAAVAGLPDHHRDPFDRLLVAQAISEPLLLLTADRTLGRYSQLVRVV